MSKKVLLLSLICSFLLSVNSVHASVLYDWAYNIDGTMYGAPDYYSPPDPGQLPMFIDDTAFDYGQGTGTISIQYTTGVAGDYYIGSYFDHEMDQATNTYFNEHGTANGTPAANQSWEIDEPGWVYGDIYSNFQNSTLDGSNNVPSDMVDDVAMALGWDFSLLGNETALINFYLSDIMPTMAPFYLMHRDPDSNESLYLYSDISITESAAPVPEPATITLVSLGLLGALGARKKRLSKK